MVPLQAVMPSIRVNCLPLIFKLIYCWEKSLFFPNDNNSLKLNTVCEFSVFSYELLFLEGTMVSKIMRFYHTFVLEIIKAAILFV